MKTSQFQFNLTTGQWSEPELPTALDSPQTLVLVFGASGGDQHPEPFRELRARFPQSHIVGCSTAGEIAGRLVHDETLTVAVAQFGQTRLATTTVAITSPDDCYQAGKQAAEALRGPDLAAVFLLSVGLNVNGTDLVKGINEALPSSVVVTGGLAGDGSRFAKTWVLHGAEFSGNSLVAVGFYGNRLAVGHGSKGGWEAFGPERLVTGSNGNVLQTLDGKPALEIYKNYLGDKAADLPASGLLFPLALRRGSDTTNVLVRTLLAVSDEDSTMTFAGDIPEGSYVQLMRADFDRLVDGAEAAAQGAHRLVDPQRMTDGPSLAVAISCVGRRLVLGDRVEDELDALADVLPAGTTTLGFYSYGELSPQGVGSCDLHNQTMTLTLFSEVAPPAP